MSLKFVALLLVVFIVFAVPLAKDIIVKYILERTVEAISGLKISISSIDVGILNTSIRVRNLIVLNPPSFKDRVMSEINHLYVNYDIASGPKKEIHIRDMIFDVKAVNVIKNERGELNLNSLKIIKQSSDRTGRNGKLNSRMPKIRIDKLRLKGGNVTYKDYTKTPPEITEFVVRVDETYENITDPYELVSIIVSRSLVKTSPSTVIGFDLTPLQNQFHGVMVNGVEVIKNTGEQLKKALQLDK